MPRHLQPVVGIAATVVVATAALFVGMNFATPETTASADVATETVATEDVAILAPIAIAGQSVDGRPVDGILGPDAFNVSRVTGEGTIVPPGSWVDGTLPAGVPDLIALIDAIGAEGDEVREEIAGPTGDEPAADGHGGGAGDPCSPEPGTREAPTDCPDGLHSAIFADTFPEDIRLWPVPDVSTTREGTSVFCSDLTPGEGELGLGVGTNLPATITVRYWPQSDAGDVRTLTLPGIASEAAAWQAEIDATGTYTRGMYMFQHCGIMAGLAPNTDYVLSAFAFDAYGRVSESVERRFNSAGTPTIPQMFATPLGPSLLYVGVPFYSRAAAPVVQAWVTDGTVAADCSNRPTGSDSLTELGYQHSVEVSTDYLRRHNYADGFRGRVVGVYEVPEGSSVVICARWFDEDAPSWERGVPTQQQMLVVQSPDTIRPVVTLTGLNLARTVDPRSIHIQASGQFGWACGEVYVPGEAAPGGTATMNEPLCDFADGTVHRRAPGGAWSTLALNTTVSGGSEALTTRTMLRLGRYACPGTCDLPPSLEYAVPLPLITVGAGLCGSSFGDCTPPTRQTSLGTVSVRVDWEQGNTNGLDSWMIGDVDPALPDAVVPDAPRFDSDQYWTPELAADGWSGGARTVIRTDRHVTYTVSIAGDCFVSVPPAPKTGTTARGADSVQQAAVRFDGLCPGAPYTTTMELVDDAGHRTVASRSYPPGGVMWPGATFAMPVNSYRITGTMSIDTVPGWNEPWWLVGTSVYVGPSEDHTSADYGDSLTRCYTGDVHHAAGPLDPTEVDQARTIHIRAYTRVVTEALYYGVNRDATCSWPSPTNSVANVDYDIALSDLIRGVTVTGDLWREDLRPGTERTSRIQYTMTLQAIRVER